MTRAHLIHARPEPGASDGQRPSSAQVRPWTSGGCKGRPPVSQGAALLQHLSPVLRRGGLQLCPLTGAQRVLAGR